MSDDELAQRILSAIAPYLEHSASDCAQCGFAPENSIHLPPEDCRYCQAPEEHHSFVPYGPTVLKKIKEALSGG